MQWFYQTFLSFIPIRPYFTLFCLQANTFHYPYLQNEIPYQTTDIPEGTSIGVKLEQAQPSREPKYSKPSDSNEVQAEIRQRRGYRRRRNHLKKKFFCNQGNCQTGFSSEMAYRNHMRSKHNVRKRYNTKRRE